MSTSVEAQWQSQAERRRRIVKLMLLVVLCLGAFGALACFWVTQPLFSRT